MERVDFQMTLERKIIPQYDRYSPEKDSGDKDDSLHTTVAHARNVGRNSVHTVVCSETSLSALSNLTKLSFDRIDFIVQGDLKINVFHIVDFAFL